MKHRTLIAALPLALAILSIANPGSVRGDDPAPSPQHILALVDRVITNQHRDDAALEQYERLERRQIRRSAQDTIPAEDKTFRLVPTGTGTVRVQVEEGGRPVDAALYRKQLRDAEQALVWALHPNESRQRQRVEKGDKRRRERAELVDAVRNAYRFTWLGRETRNGRTLVQLQLDPNPAFKPTSRNMSLLASVHARVWVDEAAAQLVRLEAEVIRDISFGGGILGKIYRGGQFVIDQVEVAPGVWLPTRYDYNFNGRKFLFGFEMHELTEVSHYRHIGPPKDALVAIRRELGTGASSSPAP